jgi:hypothetical protein
MGRYGSTRLSIKKIPQLDLENTPLGYKVYASSSLLGGGPLTTSVTKLLDAIEERDHQTWHCFPRT